MNIIFKEILYQKLKSKPNRKFIRRLQTYVDSTDEMTLEDFQSFGRFIPRDRFLLNYTQVQSLRDDCTDIVVYLDNFYIQGLQNNTFYAEVGSDSAQSDRLIDVEKFYWDKHVSKFKTLN